MAIKNSVFNFDLHSSIVLTISIAAYSVWSLGSGKGTLCIVFLHRLVKVYSWRKVGFPKTMPSIWWISSNHGTLRITFLQPKYLTVWSFLVFHKKKSWKLSLKIFISTSWHTYIYEPRHDISNNVVCASSKVSDQPVHMRSLIRAFANHLNILCILSYWLNIIWSF